MGFSMRTFAEYTGHLILEPKGYNKPLTYYSSVSALHMSLQILEFPLLLLVFSIKQSMPIILTPHFTVLWAQPNTYLPTNLTTHPSTQVYGADYSQVNPLKPELNPICYLLALLGAHHFLHVSRIRVKLLTLR